MKLNYYTTTIIHLSFEDYHNAGLTPERIKAIIESISDIGGNFNLRCKPQYINRNWNVETMATRPELINDLVKTIKYELDLEVTLPHA